MAWSVMDPYYIDGLVKERRNSIADALELSLSCINPSTRYCGNCKGTTQIRLGTHKRHPIAHP